MMNNIFCCRGITTIENDSRAELDKDYISFLSNSTTLDTIILTDKISLLRDFFKYKDIYIVDSYEKIIERLKELKNKNVFIDVYLNNIITNKNSSFGASGKMHNKFVRIINKISYENNLGIILINCIVFNPNTGQKNMTLSSPIMHTADLIFKYDSKTQDLLCTKSRYSDPSKNSFNLKDWKLELRLKKLERIIENI